MVPTGVTLGRSRLNTTSTGKAAPGQAPALTTGDEAGTVTSDISFADQLAETDLYDGPSYTMKGRDTHKPRAFASCLYLLPCALLWLQHREGTVPHLSLNRGRPLSLFPVPHENQPCHSWSHSQQHSTGKGCISFLEPFLWTSEAFQAEHSTRTERAASTGGVHVCPCVSPREQGTGPARSPAPWNHPLPCPPLTK